MGFGQAVSASFANYFNFTGRAVRSEFWYYMLFLMLVSILAGVVDGVIGSGSEIGPAGILTVLVTIIPSLSVQVRRLHDIDRTGWWIAICLVPILGLILLLYWCCQPGTAGRNAYGALA
jgi:uncharacterized membrane protein YhaH (DUF805 family)